MAAPRRKVDMVAALPASAAADPSPRAPGCLGRRRHARDAVREGTSAEDPGGHAGKLDGMTDQAERVPAPEDDELPPDEDVQALREALPSEASGDEDDHADVPPRDVPADGSTDG